MTAIFDWYNFVQLGFTVGFVDTRFVHVSLITLFFLISKIVAIFSVYFYVPYIDGDSIKFVFCKQIYQFYYKEVSFLGGARLVLRSKPPKHTPPPNPAYSSEKISTPFPKSIDGRSIFSHQYFINQKPSRIVSRMKNRRIRSQII